eukprot:3495738-Alexandrium_andersonii.AAC.1
MPPRHPFEGITGPLAVLPTGSSPVWRDGDMRNEQTGHPSMVQNVIIRRLSCRQQRRPRTELVLPRQGVEA